MATFSAHTASPPPPSRTPAGSRASSRYASTAPRTTSARGPLAWAAQRTRTHRSIPAPPTPSAASRQSLTRLPLELLNGLPQIPAHELRERLGGPEINHELELGGLLDREIPRFGASKNLGHQVRRSPVHLDE